MKLLKSLKKPAIYFAIYFLLQVVTMFIVSFAVGITTSVQEVAAGKEIDSETVGLVTGEFIQKNAYSITFLAAIITVIVYYFILRKKKISLVKLCGVGKVSFKNMILLVFMAISCAAVGTLLVGLLMQYFSSYNATSEMITSVGDGVKANGGNSIMPWIGMFSIVVGIPVFEEILFRGLIYNFVKEHLTIKWSIVLSGIIFAIAHMNPLQAIYTFILGVILAMTYEKTKTIWAPIIIHVLYNLYGSVIVRIIAEKSELLIGAITILSMVILPVTIILFLKNNKVEKSMKIEV